MERSGLSLDAIGSAIAKGELSFAFVDVLFPQPAMSSDLTFRELASEMGTTIETLQRLYGGLGLPRPLPDTPVREDDADVVSACGSGEVRFAEIGMVPLKGVAAPVRLHLATRTT